MSKKLLRPKDKSSKAFEKKKIRDLAEDDYVDPAERQDMSESDIGSMSGVSALDSDVEGHDASMIRSRARSEQEAAEDIESRLESLSDDEIKDIARQAGIDLPANHGREDIINRIMSYGSNSPTPSL